MSRPGVHLPAVEFLNCRTPDAWIEFAIEHLDILLQDHATLELKAAQQAQSLIRRYGTSAELSDRSRRRRSGSAEDYRPALLSKMSRLAREELRHFEQVIELLAARGQGYRPVSASRYAAGMHELVDASDPARLVDSLLVGAIIEARSCERFASLVPALESIDPELARFYASLLRSEARHYQDYLALARLVAGDSRTLDEKLTQLLLRDAMLISAADPVFRFHSGLPDQALSA